MGRPFIDITGHKYGRWTVISRHEKRDTQNRILWHCICDCGTKSIIRTDRLRGGDAFSCGCYQKETIKIINRTHGMTKTRTHRRWEYAKGRVTNSNKNCWHNYGGRGISMCKRWMDSFEAFLEDMGECPPGLTLERIDGDGDYEPKNCKWATVKEQMNNTKQNVHLFFMGQKYTVMQYCELFGLHYDIFKYRYLKKKMPVAIATQKTIERQRELDLNFEKWKNKRCKND